MTVLSWLEGILFNGYQQWILAYRWPSGASHASKGSCLQATHPFLDTSTNMISFTRITLGWPPSWLWASRPAPAHYAASITLRS